jgi:hypothetical protein
LEAGPAENRLALRRFEWNDRFGAALSARRVGFGTHPSTLAFGSASLAVLWGVLELLFVEKGLLACREDEIGSTFPAREHSVCEFHTGSPSQIHRNRTRGEIHASSNPGS